MDRNSKAVRTKYMKVGKASGDELNDKKTSKNHFKCI